MRAFAVPAASAADCSSTRSTACTASRRPSRRMRTSAERSPTLRSADDSLVRRSVTRAPTAATAPLGPTPSLCSMSRATGQRLHRFATATSTPAHRAPPSIPSTTTTDAGWPGRRQPACASPVTKATTYETLANGSHPWSREARRGSRALAASTPSRPTLRLEERDVRSVSIGQRCWTMGFNASSDRRWLARPLQVRPRTWTDGFRLAEAEIEGRRRRHRAGPTSCASRRTQHRRSRTNSWRAWFEKDDLYRARAGFDQDQPSPTAPSGDYHRVDRKSRRDHLRTVATTSPRTSRYSP